MCKREAEGLREILNMCGRETARERDDKVNLYKHCVGLWGTNRKIETTARDT